MNPRALGSLTSSSVPQSSVSGFKGCRFSFELCPRKDQDSSQWGGTSSSKVLATPKCWETLQSLWSSFLPFARENYNHTMGTLQSYRPKTMPQPCLEEILQTCHLQNFQSDLIYNYCYYYFFLKETTSNSKINQSQTYNNPLSQPLKDWSYKSTMSYSSAQHKTNPSWLPVPNT